MQRNDCVLNGKYRPTYMGRAAKLQTFQMQTEQEDRSTSTAQC